MAEKKYRLITKKNTAFLTVMFLFACLFAFLFIRQLFPGQKRLVYVATIKELKNSCVQKKVKSEVWSLISLNDFIENRSSIKTSLNSYVELDLKSGARVRLGENSGCIAYYDREYGFAVQLEEKSSAVFNLLNCTTSLIITGSDFNKLMEVNPGSLVELKYSDFIDATCVKGSATIYGRASNEIKLSEKSSLTISSDGLVVRKAITVLSPLYEKSFSKMEADFYPVEFTWVKNNDSVKKLRLEIYSDRYFLHPLYNEDIDASSLSYKLKLKEGTYFWRLLIPQQDEEKQDEILFSDRFYITR